MKNKSIITVLLVSIILASCAPAVTVVPTETTAPTLTFTPVPPTPTISPTPIPTIDVEGMVIPDPRFVHPEWFDIEKLSSPILQFVRALHAAEVTIGVDISAQDVSEGLTYKAVKDQNGDTAILLMTTDFHETPYDENGIPLFIYMKNSKTGEYAWNIAYLKDIASLHGILIGAVINASEEFALNSKTGMFTNNFNMATMAWSSDEDEVPLEIMDGDTEYRLWQISNENIQEIMWFHLDIPLENKTFTSKDEAVAYVNKEIDKVTKKYGYKMTIVNVFNEVNPYTKTVWNLRKQFGEDFLIEIYQHVRETLPNAKIIYNETYNYTKSYEGTNYPYTVEMVNALEGQIDAVGMQMHMAQSDWGANTPTSIDEIVEIMRSFGIPVYVTELDVNQTYLSGSEQEKNIQQADIYEMVVRSCVRSGVCEIINFWGQADPYSWYVFDGSHPNAKACLFDKNGNPKLGYYAVLRGLTEGLILPTP